jgi:hypothetical protein
MASNIHIVATARNGMLNAITTALGSSPYLRLYDGTQPTNADTSLGAQVMLAELNMSATPFPGASAGSMDANTITDESSAPNGGTCTWGSLVTSGGTRIVDFEVGTSASDMNLNTVTISAGATVSCSAFTISLAA